MKAKPLITPGQTMRDGDSLPFLGVSPRDYGINEPMADDISLVDRALGQVLVSEGEEQLVKLAQQLYTESLQATASGSPASAEKLLNQYPQLREPELMAKLLRAFTIFFQMVNTAEQKEIVRANRRRQSGNQPIRPESIAQAVEKLRSEGKTAEQVQQYLDRVEICPTITAHPTEARRRSVMDKLMGVAEALAERMVPGEGARLDSPLDAPGCLAERQLTRSLTALWNTDELRANRVNVADEVNNSLYYFQRTILDVVAWLHHDLRAALARAYPGHQFRIGPFLRYHSWVGGDRDGNPNVTPEITWSTILLHKKVILGHYLVRVDALRRELSLSSRLVKVSRELEESIERDARLIRLSEEETQRFELQPYAHKLTFMEERLRATLRHTNELSDFRGESSTFLAHPPAYASVADFIADLELIEESLRDSRAYLLAHDGGLPDLLVQARTFGFHLATLDVRQHSREHEQVLNELFHAAGVIRGGETRYSELPEQEKVAILARELHSPRPLLPRDWEGSTKAQRTLEVLQVIRHAQRYVSNESVTCYIISMTHEVSDMLEVLVLAKEAGLVRWVPRSSEASDGATTPPLEQSSMEMVLESDLDIVPLFETIEDLQTCDKMMRNLLKNETFQLHLQARRNFQELMLGYSDSSKDGGYLAANWNLQDTQDRLASVCRDAKIDFRFFHGRGGTVGRGGGRASRAILSQPKGSFTGRIRFTEQGEVVSFRYSLPPMAHRHLEQIVNSVLVALTDQQVGEGEARNHEKYGPAMAEMAAHSRDVYRRLVYDDAEFWDFYTRATPIPHISQLPITSRPASRGGKGLSGLEELRAIPWVFAWVQSRYVLPGWYGIGSALEEFASRSPEKLEALRTMYQEWPFFHTVVDNAQLELVRTHLETAALYANRVIPGELGQRFHSTIVAEYERSREWVLKVTGQQRLLDSSPAVQQTVELRNPVVLPLNKLQVAIMDLWREAADKSEPGARNPWQDPILLSITGIAAGMQSTG